MKQTEISDFLGKYQAAAERAERKVKMKNTTKIRQLFGQKKLIVAPGAHDALTAKITRTRDSTRCT